MLSYKDKVNISYSWGYVECFIDLDDFVDATCPVDGNFKPIPKPEPVREKVQRFPSNHLYVSEAMREDRKGLRVERFENLYFGESEDDYSAILEHLGAPNYMSFNDACNIVNVE